MLQYIRNETEFLTKEEDRWPRDPSHHLAQLPTDDPELKQDVQTIAKQYHVNQQKLCPQNCFMNFPPGISL